MPKISFVSITSRTLPISFVVLSVFSFLLAACASNTRQLHEADQFIGDSQLVWPDPPADAKIRFLKSIRGSRDIGGKSNWVTKVIRSISGEEEHEEQMARPYGVYSDEGRLYVTDPGFSLVHLFDFSERRYFQIKTAKNRALESPLGIVVDGDGKIFITDSVLRGVFAFNKDGKYIGEIGSPDLFKRPTGIALHNDRIYVVDTQGHNVKVFSHDDWQLLFQFGKNGLHNGEFHFPTHIFASADGRVYITDTLNFRVQIFNGEGKFLSAFGRLGDTLGDFSKPKGIATDSDGNIYVADSQFDNVQIFDQSGRLLLVLGGSGTQKGRMSLPAGIFIDRIDRLYVADSYNKRIQVFQYVGKRSK